MQKNKGNILLIVIGIIVILFIVGFFAVHK